MNKSFFSLLMEEFTNPFTLFLASFLGVLMFIAGWTTIGLFTGLILFISTIVGFVLSGCGKAGNIWCDNRFPSFISTCVGVFMLMATAWVITTSRWHKNCPYAKLQEVPALSIVTTNGCTHAMINWSNQVKTVTSTNVITNGVVYYVMQTNQFGKCKHYFFQIYEK